MYIYPFVFSSPSLLKNNKTDYPQTQIYPAGHKSILPPLLLLLHLSTFVSPSLLRETETTFLFNLQKMQMTKSNTARRAWNILRLALLWARKGGVLRRRLMLNLPKYIKSLRHHERGGALRAYGERQLSFDDTPVIHVKMHRPSSLRFKLPHIPCINPAQVDFEFDINDDDDDDYDDMARKSFMKSADDDDGKYYGYDQVCEDKIQECDDKGIDMKAEEFIAKFYEQMKLQRQISYIQYHDRNLTVDQNCA